MKNTTISVTFPSWQEAALFMDEMKDRFRFDMEVSLSESDPHRLWASA